MSSNEKLNEAFEPPRVESTECPNCGYEHRFPVKSQSTHVIDHHREIYGRLSEAFQKEINWLDDMFPDVPIREAIQERSKRMQRAIKLTQKALKDDLSFEEECELNNILSDYQFDD